MDNFLLVFDNVLEEDLVDSLNQAIVNEDFAEYFTAPPEIF